MKIFKLKTWVNIFLIIGTVFLLIRLITPSYPNINNEVTVSQVKSFIDKVFKEEARNINYEYMDSPSGGAPVEYIRAVDDLDKTFANCKNDKICLIKTYNEFMNNWASDRLRRQTRAYYMVKEFGILGEQLNEFLWIMY